MTRWVGLALAMMLASTGVAGAQSVERQGKAWLDRYTRPAEMNVTGTWKSDDWGPVKLEQPKDGRGVTGTGDGWDITGVVSGKELFLIFSGHGKVAYSAKLSAEGEIESSKTKPMVLAK